jgi:predicted dehydrogenase
MAKKWNEMSALLVGCGSIGKRHARVLAGMGVEDIRACDTDTEQVRQLIRETPVVRDMGSFESGLLTKPDAVFILTPPKLHIGMALQALDAGCHVFIEKPLADDASGIDDLERKAVESNRQVMVGLCFRFHEGMIRAKETLDSGRIGRIISIRALMGEHLPTVRPDYRALFSSQYSGAFDLVHDIDLALWYTNEVPDKIYSVYGTFSDIGIQAPDTVEILMSFAGGKTASVHLDFFQIPRRRQLELIGTEGVLIIEFASWDECNLSVYSAKEQAWSHTKIITRRDDMFIAEDKAFLTCAAEQKAPPCPIGEARKSLDVVLGAAS